MMAYTSNPLTSYGTETSQDHCPSLAKSAGRMNATSTVVGSVILKKVTVHGVVTCVNCNKPRCVFSAKKLSAEQNEKLWCVMEDHEYSCCGTLRPTGHSLHDIIVVRNGLSCSLPIRVDVLFCSPEFSIALLCVRIT